jgi:formylglycine-generating enzyme required for sulfatase activity
LFHLRDFMSLRSPRFPSALPALSGLFALFAFVAASPSFALDPYAEELVAIPAGRVVMGGPGGDRDERPAREAAVAAFSIGRTEVTLGWYLRCMAAGACSPPTWWSIGYFEEIPKGLKPEERMRLPVTGVSWRQAQDFCRWLGPGYALPTEAEWEHAAAGGKNFRYPWGDDPEGRREDGSASHRLRPAPASKPNPFGLHDLATGAWEWVDDCYARRGGKCISRTTKGGSWSEHTWNLRVANKSFGLENEGYKGLGFRVVYRAP